MTAVVRSVLCFILAWSVAGRMEANVPNSAQMPAALTFGYDGTEPRHLRLRQPAEQADCGGLRPYGGARPTTLLPARNFADPALRFTGKERDSETGLDYFGARYFSAAQGRFTSPDPLGANLLRVLNPQRWNMYTYAVNNPLAYTDPDGRDAVAVQFKTLAAGAGHLGTISVHRDGSATFMDYGPRGGAKPIWGGQYRVEPLRTKLALGPNGVPLPGSFAALTGEVAELGHVDPSTISLAYFKTSDSETAALDAHLENLRRYSQSWASWLNLYVVGAHDCAEVCNVALSKAGIGRGSEGADIPNMLFNWLFLSQAHASYSGETGKVKQNKERELKPEVHSTIKPCREGDPNCGGQ